MPTSDSTLNSTQLAHLLGLGLLQARATRAESLAVVDEIGPLDAAAVVVRHKVGNIARAVAVELGAATDARNHDRLATFAAEITSLRAEAERSIATATEVLAILRAQLPDVDVLLMKGVAAREWYPSAYTRDVGDVDLWTPTVDDAFRIVSVLHELGYDYETAELPWLKRDLDGTLIGQIKLLHENGRAAVDVHAGPYSIRYCGLIRFRKSSGLPSWGTMSPEDNLCAVIGNVAGDCFIDAKTMNDVLLLLGRHEGTSLDLDYVADTLADAGLAGFTNALLDAIASACAVNDHQAVAIACLRRGSVSEDLGLSREPDTRRRVQAVVDHAEAVARRMTGDAAAAHRIANQARVAYETPKRYRMVRLDEDRSFLPELNPWTCLRLAPQRTLRDLFQHDVSLSFPVEHITPLASGLELLASKIGNLVRFGEDVFVPTLDYVFPALLVYGEPVESHLAHTS
jgi:putative nucleotidyltransferase-like protein